MLGGVLEELPDESEAFVVGYVGGGLVLEGPAVEEVGEVGLDDGGCDCRRHGEGVEGHLMCLLLVALKSDNILPAVVQRKDGANRLCSFRNVRVLLLFGQSGGL